MEYAVVKTGEGMPHYYMVRDDIVRLRSVFEHVNVEHVYYWLSKW